MEENERKTERKQVRQHEDVVLKTCMQFFAEELLPYLGIPGKVAGFAPTESVVLELRKLSQDFNVILEGGSWIHFEFQSTNEGVKGLRRFRSYEALASYHHGVSITTVVLYSGNIRNPITELKEGLNIYRVLPVSLRNLDGDAMLAELEAKAEAGGGIDRKDMVPLALVSLMGGRLSQKERIKSAFRILRKAGDMPEEHIRKLEAVIYAMADKFLDRAELEEIKEEIKMTRLGQMLVEEALEQGLERGEDNFASLTRILLGRGKNEELLRASEDKEYRKELFAKYGIEGKQEGETRK